MAPGQGSTLRHAETVLRNFVGGLHWTGIVTRRGRQGRGLNVMRPRRMGQFYAGVEVEPSVWWDCVGECRSVISLGLGDNL